MARVDAGLSRSSRPCWTRIRASVPWQTEISPLPLRILLPNPMAVAGRNLTFFQVYLECLTGQLRRSTKNR